MEKAQQKLDFFDSLKAALFGQLFVLAALLVAVGVVLILVIHVVILLNLVAVFPQR